jgi:hypothetical protein
VLPEPYDPPSEPSKFTEIPLVATPIVPKFIFPERLKLVFPRGQSISMPKIAVNKNREFLRYKYKIGTARKSFNMFSKSITASVQFATNEALERCVFGPHARHDVAALGWCKVIHCGNSD